MPQRFTSSAVRTQFISRPIPFDSTSAAERLEQGDAVA